MIASPRWMDDASPVFVTAEAGVNHDGDLAKALALVDVAAAAGADAVKFQTFSADALVTAAAPKAPYQIRNDGTARSQREMLSALEFDRPAWEAIAGHCAARGIAFLSTPFDEASADLLQDLGVTAFKTSSGDLTHESFLADLARRGLPMIVSTGMADLGESERALAVVAANGAPPVALLHCVSDYPAAPEDANLNAIATMGAAFGVPVGWSDHTLGSAVALAAVALGARIVEKHFTLDRTAPGPDHAASLEPDDLARLVADIRTVEAALGDGQKRPRPSEEKTAAVARRSLVALRPIAAGKILTPANCGARRPGTGLAPSLAAHVLGRRAARDIAAGTVLALNDLA